MCDSIRQHINLSFCKALSCMFGADNVYFNVFFFMQKELTAGGRTKLLSLS